MEELADDEWWLEAGIVNVREIRRMLDVEFISELFIALVSGPQDKKKTLDDYYSNFESAMPQQSEWIARFERTRDFMGSLFSPQELRRWHGKSDFYTLFLTLSPLVDRSPRLTSLEKEAVRAELATFRSQVDQAKRKDNQQQFAKDVHEYADAVTRAATDLGRRNARLQILETRLQSALAGAPKLPTGSPQAA